jgi:hypothetical protein
MEKFEFWKKFSIILLATGFIGGCVKLNDDFGQKFNYKKSKHIK